MDVQIKDLKKSFGDFVLFDGLNVTIETGKITCIYGASGCGKTTLLDMIGQIQPFDCGSILYDGHAIRNKKERKKFLQKDVGFIFQDYGLIENDTVKDNLQLMHCAKADKEFTRKAKKILKQLNLDESYLKRKVYGLSGGEQQRVTIAKILLKHPSMILADEPTASLGQLPTT